MNKEDHFQPIVYLIDSDLAAMHPLIASLELSGVQVATFSSTAAFLSNAVISRPCCIIAEASLENQFGDLLQATLSDRYCNLPVIFSVNQLEVKIALRLMENGAVTVIEKPFDIAHLKDYVAKAVQEDSKQFRLDAIFHRVNQSLNALTSRQLSVLESIVASVPTKRIALQLSVSERLVEKERSEILRHFQVASTPDVTLLIGEYLIISDIRLPKLQRQSSPQSIRDLRQRWLHYYEYPRRAHSA